MTARFRLPPVSRRAFWLLIAIVLALRVALLFSPGYVNDVDSYKRWALQVAEVGLSAAYDTRGIDYPPLFLYALYVSGGLYRAVDPAATAAALPTSPLLTALVKLPHLIFDLALGALLFHVVARRGYWGARRAGAGHGRTAVLLYLWNPAALWVSAYWGQPDGVHSALALAAFAALAVRAPLGAGALLSAACLMKPLAAPLVPLLAVAAAARDRLRGVLLAGCGGLAVALVAFLPYAVTGRLGPVLRRVLLDLEAMPFTSVNGHNLWWLAGGWRDANATLAGGLTPKLLGLLLFLAVYATLLARSVGWLAAPAGSVGAYGARLCLLAGAITCAFFFLTTHMHENHLYMALPFLLAAAGRSPRLFALFAACSLAILLNTTLHDPELPYALWSPLDAPSPVTDPHMQRPFTWLQLAGSFLDAALVGAVAVGSALVAWDSASSDEFAEP